MKFKILIVDDEPDVIAFLGKRLETSGYEVISAADGAEGFRSAKAATPDLILLDILMPHRDGFAMLGDVRGDESTRNIPVVIVSAKGESTSIFQGQELGAVDYIIKPYDFKELLRYIKKYTE
jgi:DNA-binding response OmpR family regulator